LLQNPFFVILNGEKDLNSLKIEILRFTQKDIFGADAGFSIASINFGIIRRIQLNSC